MSEHCTFVLTGKTLCEIPLPLCAWLQKRKRLWVIHLSVPFKAFSAFQQRQMAFVSSVSLVMFYLVWNIKITNFLFTNAAPKIISFCILPTPEKEFQFCKKQSHIHFVVLCASRTKGSELHGFFPPYIHNRDMLFSLSFKFKGRCCPRQRILIIRCLFFM